MGIIRRDPGNRNWDKESRWLDEHDWIGSPAYNLDWTVYSWMYLGAEPNNWRERFTRYVRTRFGVSVANEYTDRGDETEVDPGSQGPRGSIVSEETIAKHLAGQDAEEDLELRKRRNFHSRESARRKSEERDIRQWYIHSIDRDVVSSRGPYSSLSAVRDALRGLDIHRESKDRYSATKQIINVNTDESRDVRHCILTYEASIEDEFFQRGNTEQINQAMKERDLYTLSRKGEQ